MSDYTPKVTKDDIDRIIARDYPTHGQEDIWEILKHHGYGEAFRIYAATLKESNGDMERLKSMINLANQDYRDLLVAAEYPAQMKEGLFGSQNPETIKADAKQYYDWFNR